MPAIETATATTAPPKPRTLRQVRSEYNAILKRLPKAIRNCDENELAAHESRKTLNNLWADMFRLQGELFGLQGPAVATAGAGTEGDGG